MAHSKSHKFLMVSILMAVLLLAFAGFAAQTVRRETPDAAQTVSVFPEKDKQERIWQQLAMLLKNVGVKMGPALPTSDNQTYQELRVHLESSRKPDSAGLVREGQVETPTVLSRMSAMSKAGTLPRERSLELSPDQMLVVALDEAQAVRWWKLMIDPRLVRAEVGQTSEMRSENYYRASLDFIVECPDERLLKEIRFYHPVWNGKAFHLELLGEVPLH